MSVPPKRNVSKSEVSDTGEALSAGYDLNYILNFMDAWCVKQGQIIEFYSYAKLLGL